EAAQAVARAVAIKMLATIADAIGSLDRVAQVLKLTGFINAEADFEAPNQVMNGASDLFVEAFGPERGRHCRSAIGAGTLVGRQSVEIEGIVLVA
ncbi:MAG: RidA family protein, partial [Pseudomonadota bacterium]